MSLLRARIAAKQTVFHITHHKAGSQWVYGILKGLYPHRTVRPLQGSRHFLGRTLEKGLIYPTVYLDAHRFAKVPLPNGSRAFTVIRDLRDTLISLYFSLKVSHPLLNARIQNARTSLEGVSKEDGLVMLIRGQPISALSLAARIQSTWADRAELLVKYEDLIADDRGCMTRILSHCELTPGSRQLEEVLEHMSFEKQAGRRRGSEDISSHLRKGEAGDWRNHFTSRVTDEFKKHYSDVLVKSGYEKDTSWE